MLSVARGLWYCFSGCWNVSDGRVERLGGA